MPLSWPQTSPTTPLPAKIHVSDYRKRRMQSSSWADEVETSDTPILAPPFQDKFQLNDETMILVLEATQHNKNPVIKVIMDMITEVMTKKEKGVRKLDPISNRITDTNNRRTYFLTEFASHLRKLLLQELGAESGIINVYPLKHLTLEGTNPPTINNAAHSDEEWILLNKVTNIKDENGETQLQTAWLMLFSVTFNVLRAHNSPPLGITQLNKNHIIKNLPNPKLKIMTNLCFRKGEEEYSREIDGQTQERSKRIENLYPTHSFQKKLLLFSRSKRYGRTPL